MKIIVYSLCGLLAALAGVIEVARLSSAQPTAGTGYELDAIAAVVLGGTSLAGGKGRIVGTLIGALILGFPEQRPEFTGCFFLLPNDREGSGDTAGGSGR